MRSFSQHDCSVFSSQDEDLHSSSRPSQADLKLDDGIRSEVQMSVRTKRVLIVFQPELVQNKNSLNSAYMAPSSG